MEPSTISREEDNERFFNNDFVTHCLRSPAFEHEWTRCVRIAAAIRSFGNETRRSLGEQVKLRFRGAEGEYCYLHATYDTLLALHEKNVKQRSFIGALDLVVEGARRERCKIRLPVGVILVFDLIERAPFERHVRLSSDTFTA